ncbi:Aste57867_20011 [Aphanomyces stellatus]|uniref:Aste57867_20011 protein n=1 Tax=Aphanomyces stellatus TaxID=120398 RepID=A0A485LIM3_9STRA|nr:hypothetical protein As57867_019945 [Aphanomyces stellatus]VFT96708.1 Aste57867_20011 [Aphanomyces stellatus]
MVVAASGSFVVSTRPAVPTALKNVALQAVQRGAKEAKTLKELAQVVQADMDSTQGLGWHVVVGKDFAVDIRYRKGCCALLNNAAAGIKVLVYRTIAVTADLPTSPVLPPKTSDASSIKAAVMETDMPTERQAQVIDACQRLMSTTSETDVLGTKLKAWLTKMYGPTWHVAVANARELVGAVHANPESMLDVLLAQSQSKHTRFLVYQHAGMESALDLLTLLHRVTLVLAAMAGAMFLFYRMSYRRECVEKESDVCTTADHTKAVAGDFWQFVSTIAVVALIGAASLVRVSRNSIRQKIKHV